MSLPQTKTLQRRFRLTGPEAEVIRQAFEWSEGARAKPMLNQFYREKIYRSGMHASIDGYRKGYASGEDIVVALQVINKVLGGRGVKYIASVKDTARSKFGVEYVDLGSRDKATIVFDYSKNAWGITSWGQILDLTPQRFRR